MISQGYMVSFSSMYRKFIKKYIIAAGVFTIFLSLNMIRKTHNRSALLLMNREIPIIMRDSVASDGQRHCTLDNAKITGCDFMTYAESYDIQYEHFKELYPSWTQVGESDFTDDEKSGFQRHVLFSFTIRPSPGYGR